MSVWSGIGSTLGKQFAKRDALPFLAGAIGAFVLLPKFAYDESMYAVSFWYFFLWLRRHWNKTWAKLWNTYHQSSAYAHGIVAHLLRAAATIFNWVVTRQ